MKDYKIIANANDTVVTCSKKYLDTTYFRDYSNSDSLYTPIIGLYDLPIEIHLKYIWIESKYTINLVYQWSGTSKFNKEYQRTIKDLYDNDIEFSVGIRSGRLYSVTYRKDMKYKNLLHSLNFDPDYELDEYREWLGRPELSLWDRLRGRKECASFKHITAFQILSYLNHEIYEMREAIDNYLEKYKSTKSDPSTLTDPISGYTQFHSVSG